MLFSVDRVALLVWLGAINKSFSFANVMHDAFKCLRLSFRNDSLSISVNDGSSYANMNNIPCECVDCDDLTEVAFLLYFEELLKIVSASNKDKITFKWEDPIVIIRTEGCYRLNTMKEDTFAHRDFPTALEMEIELRPLGDLTFVKVLDTLTPFAAKELARPELAGVSVSDDFYVSTVGVYGVIHKRVEDVVSNTTLSPFAIKFLGALDLDTMGAVFFGRTDNCVCVQAKDFFYLGQLPIAAFPYEQLYKVLALREQYKFRTLVKSSVFHGAIRRVLLLDTDKFSSVLFKFEKDFIEVSCTSQARGSISSEQMPVEELRLANDVEFEPIELCFGVPSLEGLRRLFEDNELPMMLSIISDRHPVFFQQRGSGYMFYSALMRKT